MLPGALPPKITFDGNVLDGWYRYQACEELGRPATKFQIDPLQDPVAFVQSVNLHRRHLTGSQRSAAVVKCAEWKPDHRPNKKVEPSSTLSKTNEELAAIAGVSTRTISDTKTAEKAGLGDAVKGRRDDRE